MHSSSLHELRVYASVQSLQTGEYDCKSACERVLEATGDMFVTVPCALHCSIVYFISTYNRYDVTALCCLSLYSPLYFTKICTKTIL